MKKTYTTIILILILALACIIIWLFEILEIKGWFGLDWLDGHLYSPYAITLLVVFAYLTPFLIHRQANPNRLFFLVLLLCGVGILGFEAGKRLSAVPYSRFGSWDAESILILSIMTIALFLFLGISFWFVTHRWIKKNSRKNIFLISFLAVTPIPLSLLMVKIYNFGGPTDTGWIDAVKMGYPFFWIATALGLAGTLIARQDYSHKKIISAP